MGRQRTIDREKLLEAIFDIVMEQGAAALTIDTVAKKWGFLKVVSNIALIVKKR